MIYAAGAVLIRIFNFANADNFVVQSLYASEFDVKGNKNTGTFHDIDPSK